MENRPYRIEASIRKDYQFRLNLLLEFIMNGVHSVDKTSCLILFSIMFQFVFHSTLTRTKLIWISVSTYRITAVFTNAFFTHIFITKLSLLHLSARCSFKRRWLSSWLVSPSLSIVYAKMAVMNCFIIPPLFENLIRGYAQMRKIIRTAVNAYAAICYLIGE